MREHSQVILFKKDFVSSIAAGRKGSESAISSVQSEENNMASVTTHPNREAQPDIPTILLVEDEARVRKVMAQVLKTEGYVVLESATAEHALAHPDLGFSRPTMLITDVMLPGKTGRQLALDMRNRVPGIKTLLVSGYGESVALMGAERTDEISYLPKPFSASSLLAAVRRALREVPTPDRKAV
jgi:DNA-binding NtrC family response regulator